MKELRSNYLNNKAAIYFYYSHVQYIRSASVTVLIKILLLKIVSLKVSVARARRAIHINTTARIAVSARNNFSEL